MDPGRSSYVSDSESERFKFILLTRTEFQRLGRRSHWQPGSRLTNDTAAGGTKRDKAEANVCTISRANYPAGPAPAGPGLDAKPPEPRRTVAIPGGRCHVRDDAHPGRPGSARPHGAPPRHDATRRGHCCCPAPSRTGSPTRLRVGLPVLPGSESDSELARIATRPASCSSTELVNQAVCLSESVRQVSCVGAWDRTSSSSTPPRPAGRCSWSARERAAQKSAAASGGRPRVTSRARRRVARRAAPLACGGVKPGDVSPGRLPHPGG
jgi:hypothetical protein